MRAARKYTCGGVVHNHPAVFAVVHRVKDGGTDGHDFTTEGTEIHREDGEGISWGLKPPNS